MTVKFCAPALPMQFDTSRGKFTKMSPSMRPISKPDGTGWDGATGYVQDVAKENGVPKSCGVLMCGMKGMAEGVKALAAESGIDEDKVLTNF